MAVWYEISSVWNMVKVLTIWMYIGNLKIKYSEIMDLKFYRWNVSNVKDFYGTFDWSSRHLNEMWKIIIISKLS